MSGREGNEFTTQALEIAGYHLISESNWFMVFLVKL